MTPSPPTIPPVPPSRSSAAPREIGRRAWLHHLVPLLPIFVALLAAWFVANVMRPAPHAHQTAAAFTLSPGTAAPDFNLPDSAGRRYTLRELLQQGPVLVTFYLNEDCPHCLLQLHELARQEASFRQAGVSLVAISENTPEHTASRRQTSGDFPFPLLADVDHHVAAAYGLYTPVAPDPVARHGVFLVMRDGVIAFTHAGDQPYMDMADLVRRATALTKP